MKNNDESKGTESSEMDRNLTTFASVCHKGLRVRLTEPVNPLKMLPLPSHIQQSIKNISAFGKGWKYIKRLLKHMFLTSTVQQPPFNFINTVADTLYSQLESTEGSKLLLIDYHLCKRGY